MVVSSRGHHLREERAAEFGIAPLERLLDARGRIRKEGMKLAGDRPTRAKEHAKHSLEPTRHGAVFATLERRSDCSWPSAWRGSARALAARYGADALRWWFLRDGPRVGRG